MNSKAPQNVTQAPKANQAPDVKQAPEDLSPEFKQWADVLKALDVAQESNQTDLLLTALLTPDERDALISRLNILYELMDGRYSQRQISQMLKVGVATITRGSTELKKSTDEQRDALKLMLNNVAQDKSHLS